MPKIEGLFFEEDDGKIHFVTDELMDVLNDIVNEYAKAKDNLYVNKPKAYALYQVWKKYDAKEKKR